MTSVYQDNGNFDDASAFTDIELKCTDCGMGFCFSAGEQAFFKSKGFENEPKRCPECRRKKRQAYNKSRY